ncbi:phage distal tail protein [Streptomyces sp. NPDC102381]|uniref:phage distal tail protein n=1 Tax=Streptomyces sp. NPDC102381 TaxID=3366164 RepID=UPI00381B2A30
MAELSDWTCEFGGLVMGEPDSPISIVGVDGLLTLPEIRSADQTLVQRDGLWVGDDYLNGRTVTLTLEVYGRTRDEFTTALSSLQAVFRRGGAEAPFRFRFPGVAGDQTAYVMARCRKRSAPLDLNFAYLTCNLVVELFATSPYIVGDVERELTVQSPWDGTSTALRFSSPGNESAFPVITLTNAQNCVLTDEVTGRFFGLTYGGTVTIDAAARTVVSAAGNHFEDRITDGSTWPEFEFGEHRLTLTSEAVTAPTVATIKFRDRWT